MRDEIDKELAIYLGTILDELRIEKQMRLMNLYAFKARQEL